VLLSGTDYQVVPIDDTSALVFLASTHDVFKVDRDLGERLADGAERLQPDEAREWELLAARCDERANASAVRHGGVGDGADLAININLTNLCNLACTYCFAEGGDYGRISSAMTAQSVPELFAFVERHVTPSKQVRLEFFGGEPLANAKLIHTICDAAERMTRTHGISFVHRISTNLTILPDDIVELFARHRFIVSVSLDGGREVQDRNRPTKSGAGSFDRIMANVERVRAAGEEITLVARMTVATASPTVAETVKELWALNVFDYFQIYPGVFPIDDSGVSVALTKKGEAQPSATRYVNFFLQPTMVEQFRELLAVYPTLFCPDNRFKGVLEYERTVQMVLEGLAALSFCSGGRTYFTHSPDHSISPCHRLVGEPSFDVGTGPEGLTREPVEWRTSVEDHPVCGKCWARFLCGGGCKQENFAATGSVHGLNQESCQYQLLLSEEVLRLLGRAAPDYLARDRSRFEDLFVSCGRPVVANDRRPVGAALKHFSPITEVPRLLEEA
jgi:uncharacterized protein